MNTAMTLVEVLVVVAVLMIVVSVCAFVAANTERAIERTLGQVRLHNEAAMIMRAFEDDISAIMPQQGLDWRAQAVTLMRSGGGADQGPAWVHWRWDTTCLLRGESAPGGSGHLGQGVDSEHRQVARAAVGLAASPQRFTAYLTPPDWLDPALKPGLTAQRTWNGQLAPEGARTRDLALYWRPGRLWWSAGGAGAWPIAAPGLARRVPTHALNEEQHDADGVLTDNTWASGETALLSVPSAAPRAAFAVVNPAGASVNLDHLQLLGGHPADRQHYRYPSRLQLLSNRVVLVELRLSAERGALTPASYAGLGRGGRRSPLPADRLPVLGAEQGPERRPRRANLRFLVHDLPLQRLDEEDHDRDGRIDEPLIQALLDRLGPTADHEQCRRALQEIGQQGLIFSTSAELP